VKAGFKAAQLLPGRLFVGLAFEKNFYLITYETETIRSRFRQHAFAHHRLAEVLRCHRCWVVSIFSNKRRYDTSTLADALWLLATGMV
jgi:hypothetical protein